MAAPHLNSPSRVVLVVEHAEPRFPGTSVSPAFSGYSVLRVAEQVKGDDIERKASVEVV